jgi:ABC-type multidrug transport system fused ATPase/permease subunit
MLSDVYQEDKVDDDVDDVDEGFQDSPSKELGITASHHEGGYDIVILNQVKSKYRTLSNITICLLIILITPMLLSKYGFWHFSFHRTLIDVWIMSSVFAVLNLIDNKRLSFSLCAIYGLYLIPKSIFFDNYSGNHFMNLISLIIMVTLSILSFLISILHRRKTTKEVYRSNAAVDDELTERLLIDIESDEAQPKQDVEKTSMASKHLWSWASDEWRLISMGTVSLCVASCCSLAQPYFFGLIITATGAQNGKGLIVKYSCELLIIFIVGAIATCIRSWFFTLCGERIVRRVRTDLFYSIIMQDIDFFDESKTGELVPSLSSSSSSKS